jgi:ribosome-binding protein aMBF1 (putative translation factor)
MAESQYGICRLDALAARRAVAGWSIQDLARASVTSDRVIQKLECGGTCTEGEAQRIADALGDSLATLGEAIL